MLCVCPTLGAGGAERHWASLLPRLKDHGIRPRVLCLADEGIYGASLREAGVPVRCLGLHGGRDPIGMARALRVALSGGVDAILTVGTLPAAVGRVTARLRGVPHVVNVHRGPGLRLGAAEEKLSRLLAPGTDLVIAVSECQVAECTAHGYRRPRIQVIPNGIEAAALRPDRSRAALRPELDIEPDAFVVLCVAGLRREKRVELFCEAVDLARRKDPRIVGVVAGDGPQRELVEASAGEGVRILGHRADVADLFASADACAVPSAVEASSLVVLEAMAAKRPVLATRVGGTADLVEDGVTGVLVEPDDVRALAAALAAIAADPEAARAMGEAGHQRQQERFTMARMAHDYGEALTSASPSSLAGPRSGP